MSWIQKLYETYERNAGHEADGSDLLMPISHTTQQVQIEIVLDVDGRFKRATVLDKNVCNTMIPCSEESGGRAGSKPAHHPLCDKLQYVAADFLDFGGDVTSGFAKQPVEPYQKFLAALQAWAASDCGHPKLNAILRYVENGHIVSDLMSAAVLQPDSEGKILKKWSGEKEQTPAIFKVIQATQTPDEAFVRWRVEELGNPISSTWQDDALIEAWIKYYQERPTQRGYCMVTGEDKALSIQHPAKLRHGGDKAKLISANDTAGYTFRGKFIDSDEAASVGFEVTQKAHNALRWLIARQASRNGDQVVVSWSVGGKKVPDPFVSTLELLGIELPIKTGASGIGDVAQAFALRLKNAIRGYGKELEPTEDIVVMGLDSATPGRMAITFYRELKGSEFLDRIETWHIKCAWSQNFGKDRKFVGAPAPRDIAEAAYGRRVDDKLRKAVVERLLPCIVDSSPLPRDLVESTTRRASNRTGFEDKWEWEKCLGIACALFKGSQTERDYQMTLETDRKTRDYLYGRLLAIAENIESRALFVARETRDTTAARLMQRFADRPYSTWRTIELALVPYKTRLRASRGGFLFKMDVLLDDVMGAFSGDDFTQDGPLSGEFLLGYHCQRQALKPSDETSPAQEPATDSVE
ncbi:MAG: type I-C CRISPR-associated protein Cas8c/Csd1 [Burkholderiales bacterium]|nr:type I-C CRISPR-associated protein Cas8c/Csd1 [Burkholderiales bacterium]